MSDEDPPAKIPDALRILEGGLRCDPAGYLKTDTAALNSEVGILPKW